MISRASALLSILCLLLQSGCGESSSRNSSGSTGSPTAPVKGEQKKTAKAAATTPYNQAKATASIKGVASLEGIPPKGKEIDISSSADCKAKHTKPMMKEDIVVTDGKVENVLVYVKSVDGQSPEEKWSFETPTKDATIDQNGCQYIPHVVAVMVDQPLVITTSDDLPHNIHKLASDNPEFNESQQKAGMKTIKKFANSEFGEKCAKIVCNIHNWMSATLHVFPHTFFSVTKADGTYEIKGLPAGEYEVATWHESDKVAVPASQKVKIADGETKGLNFSFKIK